MGQAVPLWLWFLGISSSLLQLLLDPSSNFCWSNFPLENWSSASCASWAWANLSEGVGSHHTHWGLTWIISLVPSEAVVPASLGGSCPCIPGGQFVPETVAQSSLGQLSLGQSHSRPWDSQTVIPGTVGPGTVVPRTVVPRTVVPGTVDPGTVVPGITKLPQSELSVCFNVSSLWVSCELKFFTVKAYP